MSTKIYYASKWAGTQEELFEYFTDMKKKYFEYVCNLYRHIFKNEKEKISAFDLMKLIKECVDSGLNIHGNIDASIVVFFHKGEWYMMYFGCDFLDDGYGSDKAVAYEYWNNVDIPEDVVEEEWEERGEIWDKILGSDAPNKRGLVCELYNRNIAFDVADTLAREKRGDK